MREESKGQVAWMWYPKWKQETARVSYIRVIRRLPQGPTELLCPRAASSPTEPRIRLVQLQSGYQMA